MKGRHIALAVLITAIWGVNFSVIKIGLDAVDPFILAGIRFALCAFPAVLFIRRPDVPWRHLAGYGLVFGVGLWGVVNLGVRVGLSAGVASLVLQASAFFTLFLGAFVFREKLTGLQFAGAAVALTGLACTAFITDGSVTLAGIGLVLCGAAAWSVANIIMKKAAPKDVLGFLVWSCLFSPIPLFALDLLVDGTAGYTRLAEQVDLTAVASVLFQVYPNTLFAYWMWNWLLREYPVSTVAPLSLLVPVFGIVGSMVIFGEEVPAAKALCLVLIVLGLLVGLFGGRITTALAARRRADART
ncbi:MULTISPECIES: EamA family transporter [unclassified Streptomyces]|uniref:EamA family transporter n=1 Tax=unclassified Streptomyces TaxID=2593676 RepID=UPI0035E1C42B